MRGARWQIQLIAAAVFAVAGVFMLVDPARAELVAGLAIACYFIAEGILYAASRMAGHAPDRTGELDALRAGIGLLTAALLLGLSFVDAITLTGVRLIIVIGGVPFGLLGLWLAALTVRSGFRWGLAVVSLAIIAYGILLLVTQFVDEAAFAAALGVVAGGAIVVAFVLAAVALIRARSTRPAPQHDAARPPG
jgi:hypothetical protein